MAAARQDNLTGTASPKEQEDAAAWYTRKSEQAFSAIKEEEYAEGFLKGSIDVLIKVIQRGD